jgi:hypothetical protein
VPTSDAGATKQPEYFPLASTQVKIQPAEVIRQVANPAGSSKADAAVAFPAIVDVLGTPLDDLEDNGAFVESSPSVAPTDMHAPVDHHFILDLSKMEKSVRSLCFKNRCCTSALCMDGRYHSSVDSSNLNHDSVSIKHQ